MLSSSSIRWVTPLITVAFVVIGVSGIMMFFHIRDDLVKDLHELVGLAFCAIAIGHMITHIKPFKAHITSPSFFFSLAFGLLVCIALITKSALFEEPNPKKQLITAMMNAPLDPALTVLGLTRTQAIAKLQDQGFQLQDTRSLATIATANHKNPFDVVIALTQ